MPRLYLRKNLLTCVMLLGFSAMAQQHCVPFFIGTYTGEGSDGVYQSSLDTLSGKLLQPVLAAHLNNPSFLAVSADNRFLWTVGEMDKTYCLTAFAIGNDCSLRYLNSRTGEGSYSCYISELVKGQWLGVASYGSGLVALYPMKADGSIGDLATIDQHWGKEPHAHCILPDPHGTYFYSADLGIDKILVYTIQKGKLALFSEIQLPQKLGPRHIAFDATGQWMAVSDELASRVTLVRRNHSGAFAEAVSQTDMLPPDFSGQNAAADIHFSPDGNFLYASNRGHNSIVVYAFDRIEGILKTLEWTTQGINRPRNFAIDPSGNFLLVANQDGNDIVVFHRNKQTGLLAPTGEKVTVSHPVCLKFLNINR